MNKTVALANPKLVTILGKVKNYFQENYGNDLANIILFGSQARGENDLDSDIDLLVILKNSFDSYKENKKNSAFISEICLENDIVITCFLMSLNHWQTRNNAFIRNVKKEGIIL
ncbi:MAG: nucleotidyltransferase domain-containing protein [Cyanobacteriota bacterium]|nr:nucleotidyltransferase domain-containing protein [Cyanobacteriota bacterium]